MWQTHCKRGHPLIKANLSIRPDGKRRCKKCELQYRLTHKKRLYETSHRWAKEHPEKTKEYLHRYRTTDKFREKHKIYMKKYYPGYILKLQKEILTHYGNGKLACVCCGESKTLFLTIDHINGRAKSEIKNPKYRGWQLKQFLRSHNYPKGYQTLCFNCNSGRALNKGICPHKATHV